MKKALYLVVVVVILTGAYFLYQNMRSSGPITYKNVLIITSPTKGETIETPLVVTGEARAWFFEGSFPVLIESDSGEMIAQGVAEAQGEWMVDALVPFRAEIKFDKRGYKSGNIVLKKDNPSDRRDLDDSFSIPIKFK